MLKKLFFSLIVLTFIPVSTIAQKPNNELFNSYSKKEISDLIKANPHKIKLLNYAVNNACYISKTSNTKEVTNLKKIILPSLSNNKIRFTDLKIKITNNNQYYRIKNSDKLLIVKSFWVLNNELQIK